MENMNLALIGGLGTTEVLVIAAVAVLLFGTRKLPELGRGIARSIQEFKKGLKDDSDAPANTGVDVKKIEKE